jgi:hypothetical protein
MSSPSSPGTTRGRPVVSGARNFDPQLVEILQGFMFGSVFHTGVFDHQTHELCALATFGGTAVQSGPN